MNRALIHCVKSGIRRGMMMAEQDWMMAGVYLVGLVSFTLLMSVMSARAKMRGEVVAIPVARSRAMGEHD